MTAQAIKKQIQDIKNVTAQVVRTKETAREFLFQHDILRPKTKTNSKNKKIIVLSSAISNYRFS